MADLPDEKRILRAVQEAADHLSIGIAIMQVSTPEHVLWVNEAVARISGRPRAELEGASPFLVIAPDLIARERARMAERGQGEAPPIVFETVVQRPDGARVPVEVSATRVVTPTATLNVTFVRDISVQIEAMRTLRESEERFRRVVEAAPDGVVLLQRGRIVFLNALAAQLFGIPPGEGIGTSVLEHLTPESAAIAQERIGHMMRTGESFDPMEYHPRRAPDRVVEIKSIIIEHEGERAVLAFARDISARKRIEQELVRADRLASIGMMSAAVAHEINNPLAYVQLCLQFLDRELPALVPVAARDRVMEQVRNASHGIDRVATIVRDLRSYSRVDSGEVGSVDITTCIEQAIKLVDSEVRRRAKLVRDFTPVPPVHANASRLEQVFVNLIVNAAQAIGDGDPREHEIRVSVRRHGDAVVVEIRDTGAGIAPELRERIFEPFFSTKAVGVGTGLGLAVCRSIVEQFGGRIEVGDAPRGALLAITLPIEHVPTPTDEPTARRLRVLIVDDEPLVRRALATVLGSEHDVILAEHGQDAIAKLADHPVDVVVCDVMMPVMNGKAFYEHLLVHDPALARRFIFITGGSMGPASAFLEQVQAYVLPKPFEVAKVLELVAAAAEK